MECFEVQFTKHVKQKQKSWDDGYMTFDINAKKFICYTDNTRTRQVDAYFKPIPPAYL